MNKIHWPILLFTMGWVSTFLAYELTSFLGIFLLIISWALLMAPFCFLVYAYIRRHKNLMISSSLVCVLSVVFLILANYFWLPSFSLIH